MSDAQSVECRDDIMIPEIDSKLALRLSVTGLDPIHSGGVWLDWSFSGTQGCASSTHLDNELPHPYITMLSTTIIQRATNGPVQELWPPLYSNS